MVVHRFLQEVVRPGVEGFVADFAFVLAGDDHDRDQRERFGGPEQADHLQTVGRRHVVVEDETVHVLARAPFEGFLRREERMHRDVVDLTGDRSGTI